MLHHNAILSAGILRGISEFDGERIVSKYFGIPPGGLAAAIAEMETLIRDNSAITSTTHSIQAPRDEGGGCTRRSAAVDLQSGRPLPRSSKLHTVCDCFDGSLLVFFCYGFGSRQFNKSLDRSLCRTSSRNTAVE